MTEARWSPADLNQQRLVVRRIAVRAELNRRHLVAARSAFSARVRSALTSPWVLGGAFALGFVILRPAARRRGVGAAAQLSQRIRRVGASIVWLTHLYRRFQAGLAAGAALTARPTPTPNHPVPTAPFEET
jgi:hypothetical protein